MNNTIKKQGNVWAGIGIGILIIVVFTLFIPFIGGRIALVSGVLIYIGLIVYLFVKEKKQTAIGMLILFGIALLLVAACFGFVLKKL